MVLPVQCLPVNLNFCEPLSTHSNISCQSLGFSCTNRDVSKLWWPFIFLCYPCCDIFLFQWCLWPEFLCPPALQCHECPSVPPPGAPLVPTAPSQGCHLGFLCSDLMWSGDLSQELGQQWGSSSLPSCWLPFAGLWEPAEGSIRHQKMELELGWAFLSSWYPWCVLLHPFFRFLGIPADRNALCVCAKSFSGWLGGSCCSPGYVPIMANCTAQVPHKILCFHGDLPSTFPKRTHQVLGDRLYFLCLWED